MKQRYIIPALFVIMAESNDEAERIAGEMQFRAGKVNPAAIDNESGLLFMDEELPTVAIPNDPGADGEQEGPYSILGVPELKEACREAGAYKP